MKPRSSISAKADAQRRKTYTDRQRMSYEPCQCDYRSKPPPQQVLDRIADEQMSGGYRRFSRKIAGRPQTSNMCSVHNITRSVNGSCAMCE